MPRPQATPKKAPFSIESARTAQGLGIHGERPLTDTPIKKQEEYTTKQARGVLPDPGARGHWPDRRRMDPPPKNKGGAKPDAQARRRGF